VSPLAEKYDSLAGLFRYPTTGYGEVTDRCRHLLAANEPVAGEMIADFAGATAELNLDQMEELFTRTFDLNPECCLEVGWQLFGEKYNRGSFLVWMRQQLKIHDLAEEVELPDHLTYVMMVLGRMERTEADRFATEAVLPAMDRMLAGLKDKENPFEKVVRAVQNVLTVCHGPSTQPEDWWQTAKDRQGNSPKPENGR